MTDSDLAWWRRTPDDRVAERRAQALRRLTPWDESDGRRIALALAYRRLGYSYSGIAGEMDITEETVASYMEAVRAEYGRFAIMSANPKEVDEWPDGPFPFERVPDTSDEEPHDG